MLKNASLLRKIKFNYKLNNSSPVTVIMIGELYCVIYQKFLFTDNLSVKSINAFRAGERHLFLCINN